MNLVTGATGHIGNVLVRTLLARGESVRALLMPGEDPTPIEGLPVERIEADVLDYGAVRQAFKSVCVAYHLAGLVSIMPGVHPMLRAVNVLGTRNVLRAAQSSRVERLVYTSSIHALRRVPNGVTIDEAIPFDPDQAISDYDQSKAQASLEVLQAIEDGLPAVIACPTGVIGPYDYRRSEMGQLILDCMKARPQLYVDGAYDFVDVRDVADGHILVGEQGGTGETYILCGERISVRGLMDAVAEITGTHFPRIRIPYALAGFVSHLAPAYYRLAHARPRLTPYALATIRSNSFFSHEKATRTLGYSPRSVKRSLADSIAWFRQNRGRLESFITSVTIR
jgi:dihydroflavonol-4-reductase